MAGRPPRYYMVMKPSPELTTRYDRRDAESAHRYVAQALAPVARKKTAALGLETVASVVELPRSKRLRTCKRALAITACDRKTIKKIEAAVQASDKAEAVGVDLPISAAEHWNPWSVSDPVMGSRSDAERLIGVHHLRSKGLTGRGVNVVIVDQGLDKARLGASYGGGWRAGDTKPGSASAASVAPRRLHGMMIATNILKVAPDAMLFDLPTVPPRIGDPKEFFLSGAHDAFEEMLAAIQAWRNNGTRTGPWIVVNAWAVYDRRSEAKPGDYTNNPSHPFNQLVSRIVDADVDMVFCAGNCGQFCPDSRCGPGDRGPGSSIFGANSHPQVITVGAVRTDSLWLGYSSQGPGQPGFGPAAHEKPDLCAPSQFREDDDSFAVNGGTSAASGLVAGVVAALRSKTSWAGLPPGTLKAALIAGARQPNGSGWNGRLGHGVLNIQATMAALP